MVRLKSPQKPSPEWNTNILSVITFWWLNSLIYLGFKRPLKQEDLYELSNEKKTRNNFELFSRYWEPLKTRSIILPMFRTFLTNLILVGLMKLTSSLMMFIPAVVLDHLLKWMETRDPFWMGFFYAGLMFCASLTESTLNNNYEYNLCTLGTKMRSAVIDAVYQKALRLSPDAKNKYTTGQIVNLMSVDAQKITDFILFINVSWSSPLQISIAVYLLWQQLGIATLAGVAVMVFLIPFNAWITSIWRKTQADLMKKKDSRSKLINEVLGGIKVIKLYGWEDSFTNQIKAIRGQESAQLKRQSYYLSVVTFTLNAAPIFVALFSFLTYTLIDSANMLTASKAFVSLALFNMIRQPLTTFPFFIQFATMYFVSCKRLNEYLNSEEADLTMIKREKDEENGISIQSGTFKWSRDETSPVILENISLDVPHKKLVAVVGRVGAGKSSLLSSILGDMYKVTGSVNVCGSIAYVPQVAWIQNATLKKNILFTSELDETRYKEVVAGAALESDISILAAGDETEIGEKGINLSGGQKQRVSLARAVYADSDIYLLDDPLSAVDTHVGQHIFDQVIGPNGLLKNKTRVLVTHKINLLPFVDMIIVMKDGKVSESGTYHELLAQKGDFADFLIEHFVGAEDVDLELERDKLEGDILNEVKSKLGPEFERRMSTRHSSEVKTPELGTSVKSESIFEMSNGHVSKSGSISSSPQKSKMERSISESEKVKSSSKVIGKKLTEEEKEHVGGVTWSVYFEYFKAAGFTLCFFCLAAGTISNGFNIGSSLWLSEWSRDSNDVNRSTDASLRDLRLSVYAAYGILEASFLFLSNLLVFLGVLRASSVLHNRMLHHVMRAPMSFFDTTPVGRILNRFTKDIDGLDTVMRFNIRGFLTSFYKVMITIIIISIQTPIFLAAVVPLSVIYIFVQVLYVRTSRQLKRIESNTRSPMYSHFSETVTGSSCIRAFGARDHFIQDFEDRNDINCMSWLLSVAATRWLAMRLEFIGNIVVVLSAILGFTSRDGDPSTTGLSVSYALMVTAQLAWLVRGASDLELNLVAAERVLEYTKFDVEAAPRIEATKPDSSWPHRGLVKFEKYSTRYRPGLDLVLKEVSFETKESEKIGIVGRTGAGKSSLTLALFRLIEPASGSIIIDGVDISKLGLLDLRTKLTIIPQDPVLFTGKLRMNLDPFNEQSDERIWSVLELAHLKHFCSTLEGGLEHECAEGGENFSVGQRQLVCLARALLRKSRILILDEATAAVDLETDALIQRTIQTEFSDCTILTIAHRLNTVLDYDRILVLDQGKVVEFDTTNKLLNDPDSIFYSMAKNAGLVGQSNNTGEEDKSQKL